MGTPDPHECNPTALTADTITDEQIRELRASLPDEPEFGGFEWQRARECEIALGCSMCRDPRQDLSALTWLHHPVRRATARARCAEILNARRSA